MHSDLADSRQLVEDGSRIIRAKRLSKEYETHLYDRISDINIRFLP